MMQQLRRDKQTVWKMAAHSFLLVVITSCLLTAGIPRASGQKVRDKLTSPNAPTRVTLTSFEAIVVRNVVSLAWQSGYELDNLGYNVYREENGVRVQVNPGLIAGSALQAGQNIVLRAGNTYAWRERLSRSSQLQTLKYWLESIDLTGKSAWYGPVYARPEYSLEKHPPQSKLLSDLSVESASRKQNEWPTSPTSSFLDNETFNKASSVEVADLAQQWALAAGPAVKLAVNRNGWQRVSHQELLAAGINPLADLAKLQLYLEGIEQAIVVNPDGSIEFFGRALDTLSTDTRVYWLAEGVTNGKRVAVSSAGPFDPGVLPSSFSATVERKDRTIRFAALLNGSAGNFFGPLIPPTPPPPQQALPLRQTLQVTALDQTVASAQLEVGVQGLTIQEHRVRVQLNGSDIGFIDLNNRENAVGQFAIHTNQLRENKNTISLLGVAPNSDSCLVDFVRISYPRRYEAANNRLLFSVPSGQAIKAKGFSTSNLRVLDITDPANVSELTVSPQLESGSFAFTLPASGAPRTLLAIGAAGNFDHPQQVVQNQPSSWNLASHSADLLIFSHGSLIQSLQPLINLRVSQGLQVAVVDIEDVYDEFSYGSHSSQALQDFVARATDEWQLAPRYLMLVGDGTADPRDYLGQGSLDLVPTVMLDGLFSEAPSDDAIVDFDADGIGDLAVGRLPVTTPQETTLVVNKILTYEQAIAGDTQQRGAVMVSDLFDGFYDFEAFTADVRTSLPQGMTVQLINRSDGDTATVRAQIMASINQGRGIVNYLGHGSVGVWTGAQLLNTSDPASFTNSQQLSIFVMMTCQNGAFTEVGSSSLAEAIMKAPNGGAVAIWASSGLTIPYGQVAISKQLYTHLFTGQIQRLGDATKQSKLATADMDIRKFSILFGDPTTRFR